MNTPSGVLSTACDRLAEGLTDPVAAANTLMNHNLPGKVVEPFLQRLPPKTAPDGFPWSPVSRRRLV